MSAPASPTPASPTASTSAADARANAAGIPHAPRRRIKAPKAARADQCLALEQLPNIGPSLAASLRSIGILAPVELQSCDAHALYRRLCAVTALRQDPCVLDTFMAAIDFMEGAPARPWWHYTPRRKALFGIL